MKKTPIASGILTALLCSASVAQDISYTYLEGGFARTEIDAPGGEVDGNTFGLGGSVALSDTVYAIADMQVTNFDFDIDQRVIGLGLGAHTAIGARTDLYADVSFVNIDIETPIGDTDDNGIGANLGIRSMLTDNFELEVAGSYIDAFDDSETGASIGARFYANQTTSVQFALGFSEDTTSFAISLRADL